MIETTGKYNVFGYQFINQVLFFHVEQQFDDQHTHSYDGPSQIMYIRTSFDRYTSMKVGIKLVDDTTNVYLAHRIRQPRQDAVNL